MPTTAVVLSLLDAPDARTHARTHAHGPGNSTAMVRDMLSLLNDPDISDLTLLVQGRKIYVHRFVLMCVVCLVCVSLCVYIERAGEARER